MFFATTSEDFIRSTTNFNNNDEKCSTKLQIFVFNNSNDDNNSSRQDVSNYDNSTREFVLQKAHLVGSVGWIVQNSDHSAISHVQLQQALQDAAKRYEQITEKKSKIPCLDANSNNNNNVISTISVSNNNNEEDVATILKSIEPSFRVEDETAADPVRCLLFENLRETQRFSEMKDLFRRHLATLPPLQKQLVLAAKPSHGIDTNKLFASNTKNNDQESNPSQENVFSFVPYCVIEPGMHRRIPLVSIESFGGNQELFAVKRFQHAINLNQVAMELLQKSGLLGKYGA